MQINASRMEADQEQRRIIFTGQVRADYGDAILYADQLLVFFKPPPQGQRLTPAAEKSPGSTVLGDLGGDEIERIEAVGTVRFVQGDRVASGAKAVFYKDKEEIVLLGHPQVWRGQNHMKGSRITFNLASKKVEVASSPEQRVEAHLYPSSRGGKTPADIFPSAGPRAAPRSGRSK